MAFNAIGLNRHFPYKRLSAWLPLIFLLSAVLPALGQGRTTTVSGFIFDTQRRALELANVYDLSSGYGCSSDESGYYELSVPAGDTLFLRYSCLSYQTTVRIVPVEQARLQLNVVMQSNARQLEDVSIEARQHQTGSLQTLSMDAVRRLPDPSGGSIEALLVTYAGVNSNNELSSQYSVRGGNYDENLVYVNGIEIYRPQLVRSGQQEGLSFVNPQMTRSVLFSAGGFDACYGDKMSSVLDIQYKEPEHLEGSVDLSLLGASAFVGHATKDGRFSQLHGIRYKTTGYLLNTFETKGEYHPTYLDYQTLLTFRPHEKWALSFLGNISQNTYRFVPETRTTEIGTFQNKYGFKVYFDGQEQDVFRTFMGALNLKYSPKKGLDLHLQASHFLTQEQETFDITGEYWLSETPVNNMQADTANTHLIGTGVYHDHARNYLNAQVSVLSHRGEWKSGSNRLKWGVSLQREFITDRIREWELRDSSGYTLPYRPDEISFTYNLTSNSRLETLRTAAYVQDTWKRRTPAGLFSVTGGVRASWWSFNREWLFSPRVSVGWVPAWKHDVTFRLSGGIYYQAPFYKEMRDTVCLNGVSQVVLNHDIKAPRSYQAILGGDYRFSLWERPFILTAEAYYKYRDRLIPYTVDNVRIRYYGYNSGYGHTLGLDVKLFGEFVPGTDSWISFSLMDSNDHIDDYVIPSPNEQRYSVSLFFRDYLPRNPKYSMSLKFVWADGLCFGPPSMDKSHAVYRMRSYLRADIGVYRLLVGGEDKLLRRPGLSQIKSVWIGLNCFNLLGLNNANSYYWIRDTYNREWAIPNYLTGRLINLSLSVDF